LHSDCCNGSPEQDLLEQDLLEQVLLEQDLLEQDLLEQDLLDQDSGLNFTGIPGSRDRAAP
jgi:hypothetical protein